MAFVRQFWIFDLTLGVADPLGDRRGTKTQERAAIFAQCVSGMTGHLMFAGQPERPKKVFFWDTLVSMRCVTMPAGLAVAPRRVRTVLDRDQACLLNIFFLNTSTCVCLLWAWRQTGVIKATQDWTFCFAHCNCVMSSVHSRWQINETFHTTTKGTCSNSFGDAELYAKRWNHSDHWRIRLQSVFQIGQPVVKFLEVFRLMTKCRNRRRTVIEYWYCKRKKMSLHLWMQSDTLCNFAYHRQNMAALLQIRHSSIPHCTILGDFLHLFRRKFKTNFKKLNSEFKNINTKFKYGKTKFKNVKCKFKNINSIFKKIKCNFKNKPVSRELYRLKPKFKMIKPNFKSL